VIERYIVKVSQTIYAEALSIALTEEKRIIIRLPDTATAKTIKEQSREKIIERIKKDVDATPANRQIVA
jgi:hypothetical protein